MEKRSAGDQKDSDFKLVWWPFLAMKCYNVLKPRIVMLKFQEDRKKEVGFSMLYPQTGEVLVRVSNYRFFLYFSAALVAFMENSNWF